MKWFPYPSLMTTFLDGRWMCTLKTDTGRIVTPLNLTHNTWRHDNGKKIKATEQVIAVGYVPEPYTPLT